MGKIRERIIAYILVFCTLVSAICTGITMPVWAEEDGTKGSIDVKNYTIEVRDSSGNWVTLTDNMTVRNGQEIRIRFDWTLQNDVTGITEFEVDINPLVGILLGENAEVDLPHVDNGDSIGKYWVDGKANPPKLHIRLTDTDYTNKTGERYGGATITGTINVVDGQDGSNVDIQIGETTVHPKFTSDLPTSGAYLQKWAEGDLVEIEQDGGDVYRQTFRVQISTAYNSGKITEVVLKDKLGNGLENMSALKVVSCSNTDLFKEGESYTLDQINDKLKNQSLGTEAGNGQTVIIFEYTVDIKAEYVENAFKQNLGDDYKNIATLQYKDNKNGEETKESSAYVKAAQPSIKKTGVREEDKIKWTITVTLNGTDKKDIKSIIDTPSNGLKDKNIPVEFDWSDFQERPDEPGVFDYTYWTDIDEDYLKSVTGPTVVNKVEMTTNNGNTYPATGQYTLEAKDWIEKDVEGTDKDEEGNLLINWKVTLYIPEDVTAVQLQDWADNSQNRGQHEIFGDIYFSVNDAPAIKVIANASKDDYRGLQGDILDYTYIKEGDGQGLNWRGINFKDSLAGSKVEIYYTTKVTDASLTGKQFINNAQVFFKDINGVDKSSPEIPATWESRSALSKKASVIDNGNAIEYKLIIDLTKIDLSKASANGDVITITDTLPDGLVLEKVGDSKFAILKAWTVEDNTVYGTPAVTYTGPEGSKDGRTITFTIKVTDNLLDFANWETGLSWGDPLGLYIPYTLKMADRASFVKEGEPKDFVNHAEGKFGKVSIGSAETTTTVTPPSVVDKEGVYDGDKALSVAYEVNINEEALDLFEGDTLLAKDVLGSALSYDLKSIEVFEVRNGQEIPLELKKDYKFTYNLEENSLSFTLPDGKHLRIKYTAWISLPFSENTNQGDDSSQNKGPKLDEHNSSNTFSIGGENSRPMESTTHLEATVVKPTVWAGGSTVTLSIFKFYIDDGSMEPLKGAGFSIVAVDEENGKFIENSANGSWDVKVGEDGKCTLGSSDGYSEVQLVRGRIYQLTETQVPPGYEQGKTIYFVIPTEDTDTEELEKKGIKTFGSGTIIFYENVPKETSELTTGSLNIQKTLEGLDWSNIGADEISFKISKKDSSEEISFSIDPSKMTSNAVYSHTIPDLEPGEYTVTETVTTKEGYAYSTTYIVTVNTEGEPQESQTQNGPEAKVEVNAGETTTVHFTNTYTAVGSLTLKKTIEGDQGAPVWAKVKEGLSFEVYIKEQDGNYRPYATVPNVPDGNIDWKWSADGYTLTLENLPIGEYKIIEVASDIVTSGGTEYVLTETTYQVGNNEPGADCTETKEALGISIKTGENTEVTFTNTYAANKGSLTLQKEVEGILDGEGHPVSREAAWNAVKESLTFVVSKYDIEKNDYVVYRTIKVKETPGSWEVGSQYAVFKLEGLPVGKYKVEEISGNLDDYTVQKTVYAVVPSDAESLNEEAKSTETGDLEVKRDQNITVTFTNTYSRNMADLVLEKTIAGLPGVDNPEKQQEIWDIVSGKLTFVITDKNADGIEAITIEGKNTGWKYDPQSGSYKITISLPPGTYEVTETVSDLKDYTWKSASYTVTVTDKDNAAQEGSAQEGSAQNRESITISGITLATDDTATVSLSNIYERNKGTLILTKEIVGLDAEQIQKLLIDGDKITFTIENIDTQEEYTYTCTLKAFSSGQEEGTYTLTLGGDEMLPTGTYRIKESNFSLSEYQTEVTFNVIQPKDMQGPSGKYNPEAPPAFDIATGDDTEVTFTNTYSLIPGTLILQKTIKGDSDLAWDKVWDSLSFEVKDSSGNPVGGSPFSFTEKSNNTITLQLAPGEYTVKEIATKDGYTCETTYKVGSVPVQPDSEGKVAVTVTSGQNSTVEIENNYVQDKGTLKLTKTVDGISKEQAAAISFTIKGPGYEKIVTLGSGEFTYDESGNTYTLTLENLPVGNYTVEETAYTVEGYKVKVSYQITGGSGGTLIEENNKKVGDLAVGAEIEKNGTTQINYVDTYVEIPPNTGTLILQKMVSGDLKWDQVKESLRFEVTDSSGKAIEDSPFSWEQFELNQEKTAYVLEITGLKPDTYTVKETFISEKEKENYTRTITYTVGEGITVASPYDGNEGVKAEVSANGKNTVTFINNYSLDRGNLTITKTVEGPVPEADVKKITFTVESVGTLADGSTYKKIFTLGDPEVNYDKDSKTYTLALKNLLVGEYTVTETQYNFAGFITKEVSYQVNTDGEVVLVENGEEKGKDPAKVTVVKAEEGQAQTATVAYKDVYIVEPKGSLVLEKSITGGRGWAQIKENISFEVKLGDKVIGTYYLKDFKDDDGDGIYTKTIPDLALGTYTVTEIISKDEDGYTRRTSYQVNNGDIVKDILTAEIELEEGSNNKVTFTNDYERDMGTLVITKTIYGAIPEDKVKAALSFKVTDTATKTSATYPLTSFKLENGVYTLELTKPTGTYEITEIVMDIRGWIWRETTYTINGSGEKSGFTSTVQLNKDAETRVAYTNRYEENAGSLVIQKLVSKQDPNDSVISWDYVKDYLTFVITDENGETTEIKPKDVDFIGPDGNNMYYYIVTGLEVGKTYTVTETSSKVPNYSCTVTYTGQDERISETAAKVTVGEEGAKITFTNTYKKNEVSSPPSQSNPSTPSQPQQPAQSPAPAPGIQLQVDPTPAPSVVDGTVLSAERDRVPKTGDYFSMWLALFLVSLSGLVSYLLYLEKKNREE